MAITTLVHSFLHCPKIHRRGTCSHCGAKAPMGPPFSGQLPPTGEGLSAGRQDKRPTANVADALSPSATPSSGTAAALPGVPSEQPLSSSEIMDQQQAEVMQMIQSLNETVTPQGRSEAKKMFRSHRYHAIAALVGVMQVVSNATNSVPFAATVFSGAILAVQTLEKFWKNDEASKEIARLLKRMLHILLLHYERIQLCLRDESKADILRSHLDGFASDLNNCVAKLENLMHARMIVKLVWASERSAALAGIGKDLSDAMQWLTMVTALAIQLKVEEINFQQIEIAAQGRRREDRWSVAAHADTMEKLKPVHDARFGYDSLVDECLSGTREEVLQTIMDWVTSPDSPSVFWLSGWTGTGKTAITKTLCRRLQERSMLGASFFVTRDEPRRQSGNIVRTLAYDLARNQPVIGFLVAEAIQREPDIGARSIEAQVAALIMDPLVVGLKDETSPLVLVLDGLNSCARDREGRPGGLLISALISAFRGANVPLKLFVASSTENGVQDLFDACHVDAHPLEAYPVRADVEFYYQHALGKIERDRVPAVWPSPADMDTLVTMTDHLFVFAATVVEYVSPKRHDPEERLRSVLSSGCGEALKALDQLYLLILQDAVLDDRGHEDVDLCQRVHRILAWVVLAIESMGKPHLAHVLDVDLARMRYDLAALSSVLVVPADDSPLPVRVFHSSFSDFLCDRIRCPDARFYLDVPQEHATLARRCVELVNGLTPNMCLIEWPGLPNGEVHGVDEIVKKKLPGHVEYACRHWAVHTARSSLSSGSSMVAAVEDFLATHVPQWIEACSLLQCVAEATTNLLTLSDSLATELCEPISTLADFMKCHEVPLSASALQVYVAGPLFASNVTALARDLSTFPYPRLLTSRLSAMVHSPITFNPGAGVSCVAVSPNGRTIAAGSKDRMVHLWDVDTRAHGALHGHADSVCAIAFSPNGRELVSGSKDAAMHIWDLATMRGTALRRSHHWAVLSVSFTRDGRRIVSGAADQDVLVWSGSHACRLQEHVGPVTAVVISPDGYMCATASTDGVVLLRSTTTFQVIHPLHHQDEVYCITFSPDSSRLVSGCKDGTIYVWDLKTFRATGVFTGHTSSINSLVWPRGSAYFLSASEDRTIRRWDEATGEHLAIVRDHPFPITDMDAFPDGERIVASTRDGQIHVLDRGVRTLSTQPRSSGTAIKLLAYSPDGSLIASCGPDASLRMWAAKTGEALGVFYGTGSSPTSLSFSDDSARIIMAYDDSPEDEWVANYDFATPTSSPPPVTEVVTFSCDALGWIYITRGVDAVPQRYCWIPTDRRWTDWSSQVAWVGSMLAIGTDGGILTILDFEQILCNLP